VIVIFRKKKETEIIEKVVDNARTEHIVTKTDFPIKCPVITENFGDLMRYFLYNMSSGLITATVERMVQRELANRSGFPAKFVFGAIGIGIMIFLMCMGYVILTTGGGAGTAVQNAVGSAGNAAGGAAGALHA
jgi:hypothetical protein